MRGLGRDLQASLRQLRWPMVFDLQDCDESLLGRSMHEFDLGWDYDAEPDIVHRTFLGFLGSEPWSPGFLGVHWETPQGQLVDAVMDEFYVFMTMRVRVLTHEPGRRSVARVERWSLPLATRMLQVLETTPRDGGGTHLRYRIAYDVSPLVAPLHPPVAFAFRQWFMASMQGLQRYLDAHPRG